MRNLKPLSDTLLYKHIEVVEVDPFLDPDRYMEIMKATKQVIPMWFVKWNNKRLEGAKP